MRSTTRGTPRLRAVGLFSVALALLTGTAAVPSKSSQTPVATVPLSRWLEVYPTVEPPPGRLQRDVPLSAYHVYTLDTRPQGASIGGSSTFEGVAAWVLPSAVPGTVELKWLNHDNRPYDNFMTTNVDEANNAVAKYGYKIYAGNCGCYVATTQLPGTVPLFRLVKETHFYTTDAAERDRAISDGYTSEGIAAYVWTGEVLVGGPAHSSTPDDPEANAGRRTGEAETGNETQMQPAPVRVTTPGDRDASIVKRVITLAACAMVGTALVMIWWSRRDGTKKGS